MNQQYECGAVEPRAGRGVCAGRGQNDAACSHQAGKHEQNGHRRTLFSLQKRLQIAVKQVSDPAKLDVGGRILGQGLRVEGIVTLFRENGRDFVAPDFLDRVEDTQFIVDQYVVIGGVEAFDIVQLAFLVNVNEDAAVHRSP